MSTELADRVEICGVPFDDLDCAGVVELVAQELGAGRGGWIVTPNVDILRQLIADQEMAALVGRATLVVVDGAPVQWAGRLAGHPKVHRAPGASLALPLAGVARDLGVPMLLLGGRPGAGEQAAAKLEAVLPGLRMAHHCPDLGFEADPEKWAAVVAAVQANSGGIVLCGFGYPKQERVMAQLTEQFPDSWFLGIGGTIDFLAGLVPRAPEWLQAAGFEWTYRLAVEPRRLARRYLVDGLPFAGRMLVWAARERQSAATMRRGAGTLAPAAQRIDLDRRTVTVPAPRSGQAPRELTFGEYLAEHTAGSSADDPSPAGRAAFVDLRDQPELPTPRSPNGPGVAPLSSVASQSVHDPAPPT